jgi:hypothetical protein
VAIAMFRIAVPRAHGSRQTPMAAQVLLDIEIRIAGAA